jgi:4-amino-4-deoxy-L-arabinose transferase-like glycosyltransferase
MTRAGLAWLYALGAFALVVLVGALVVARVSLAPGAGFSERVRSGEGCAGAVEPVESSVVREPLVRHERSGLPRCVEWNANFVVRERIQARFEMTLEGDGALAIDGHPVLADRDAHPLRVRVGIIDLPRGVHSVAAKFATKGNGAYFRLAMTDDLTPHDVEIIDPLNDDAFFARAEDAAAALSAPPRPRPPWVAFSASLALALAGVLGWLAVRTRRGLPLPAIDLGIGAGLFAAAVAVRARGIPRQDVCWDEGIISTSRRYLANVAAGDFYAEAWAANHKHAPMMKWLLSLGDALGGIDGARMESAVLSAVAVALLYAFGRVAFSPRVGALAGGLAALLPLWVAYGRIISHESVILFWWMASMLAVACWMKSGGKDRLAAFVSVFAGTLGLFSRPTMVWIIPVLLVAWIVQTRGSLRERLRAFPSSALVGAGAGLAITLAMWPFVWEDPQEKVLRIQAAWSRPLGDIEVYLGKLCLPAWHYFVVAFFAETPALLLVFGLAGIVLALRPRGGRKWALLCLGWLVCPFGQTASTLRIGAARYVVQSWPALLLFAAIAIVALGELAADLLYDLHPRLREALRTLPAILAVAYTGWSLDRVEPYPLDYFNEVVGGPAGVAAREMFEVPWWGEGNRAAVEALDRTAPAGARVYLALWPAHALERLRDDLVRETNVSAADYVLVSHLQYAAAAPSGCTPIAHVVVAGAPLVDTYHCVPASETQLGYGAMSRAGGGDPEEAMTHFRAALLANANDAGAIFGMGWAMQAKGNLVAAEPLYLDAAERAAKSGDDETEYFARFDLGTLYREQHDLPKAAESFRAALTVAERAPARFRDRLATVRQALDAAEAGAARP